MSELEIIEEGDAYWEVDKTNETWGRKIIFKFPDGSLGAINADIFPHLRAKDLKHFAKTIQCMVDGRIFYHLENVNAKFRIQNED